MAAGVRRPWLALLLALATDACALTGYDFGDYERADNAVAGDAGGEPSVGEPFSVGFSAGEGGAGNSIAGDGGNGATQPSGAAGDSACAGGCQPRTCSALGLECGVSAGAGAGAAGDGCGAGQVLDCGGCFWWFQECRQNVCVIPE